MPPEQIEPRRGRTSFGSDIYSLGAILYHLLTGRPPFMAATLEETLLQSLNMDAIPVRLLNPGVPRDLETICLKCLEKDPMRRYRSASDLAGDLENWLAGRAIMARPTSVVENAWRWAKRNSSVATLVNAVSRKNRPMAGIITAIIMNGISIIWNGSTLFKLMVARYVGEKPDFYRIFPEVEGAGILRLSMWIICSGVMIVGALMSQVCHPMGNQTVRAAAWVMAFVEIAIPAYMAQVATDSVHWRFLESNQKTMLLISLIAGAAGGSLRSWLFLFLFRKSKWP
jgi:hypothetical protein